MEMYTIAHWEGNEYIIKQNGISVGETLTKRRAESILAWLQSARHEL